MTTRFSITGMDFVDDCQTLDEFNSHLASEYGNAVQAELTGETTVAGWPEINIISDDLGWLTECAACEYDMPKDEVKKWITRNW